MCKECGKVFSQNFFLVQYERIYIGDKFYKCVECGKFFCYSIYFIVYRRIYIGEKFYECQDCGRVFNQNFFLGRYKRTYIGEKLYICSVCGKFFLRIICLFLYLRIYIEERFYECNYCGKGFRYSFFLVQYQRKYVGEKFYECRQRLIFEQILVLTKYEWAEVLGCDLFLNLDERVFRSDRFFKCNQCGKCFIQSSYFIRYQIIYIREEFRGRNRRREQLFGRGSYLGQFQYQYLYSGEYFGGEIEAGQFVNRAFVLFDIYEIMYEKNSVYVIGVEEFFMGIFMLFDIREFIQGRKFIDDF